MDKATVADELAFDALPCETRNLIMRLAYNDFFRAFSSEGDLREARDEGYKEGYEDGKNSDAQDEYDQGYEKGYKEGYEAARQKFETPET